MGSDRPLLVVLLIWALLMIVPDFARVVRPLASFGFYANNDGLIYDVTGPFADKSESPAWKAGVREGDRLDLSLMRCLPYDSARCASILAAVGGIQYVAPGRAITIDLAATPEQGTRRLVLLAEPRPQNWFVSGVILLDQIAGILVVLAAGWLVWTRPGPMSWGFLLYVVWFNPGQSFEFYAQLQRWPLLLLAQDVAACIAQAAGFAGLLLFAIRAPADKLQSEWARVERALPLLALAIALALLASYGSAVGFKTEILTRATILIGLAVSLSAFAILMLRRHSLSPKDNQRLKWVIWGCLIGLPASVIADLSQYTTLFKTPWGDFSPSDDAVGLFNLVNGILCLFVFEAVRRPHVVSVSIPLRRVTLLALTMSVPALLLHREAEHFQETLEVPQWTWLLIGAVVVFVIGRLHHAAVELADRFFNRDLDRAEQELGEAIVAAKDPATVDHLLSDGPLRALKLASAVTFRRTEEGFHRYENGVGWDGTATRDLQLGEAAMTALSKGASYVVDDTAKCALPLGLEGPLLAVPAASRTHCYAATLYGPHEVGTDLDPCERQMLLSLGRHAADAYARLENVHLRQRIKLLESQRPLISSPT